MSGSRGLAPFREVVLDGLGNLQALKGRTLLALTGIAIGTAAVIAMLHVGHNARAEALRQFEVMGVDLVAITPRGEGTTPTILPLETVRALPSPGLGIAQAVPFIATGTMIRAGGATIQANLVAVTDGLYALAKVAVAQGRRTSELDGFAPFVVLGADLARDMAAAAGQPVQIGDAVRMDDQVLTVVGVLGPAFPVPLLGLDLNRSAVIPFGTARRLVSDPQITTVAARLAPGADDRATAARVADYFHARLRPGDVQVQTARQLIDGLEQQMRVYGLLLLAIGAVSLVVGGVGVMNVMLMSVMERRREIGLRLAIGARRRDIRTMFLTEALILAALGSLLGTGLGTLAGWLFAEASGWSFLAAPFALPLGCGMALAVGLFFGSPGRPARSDRGPQGRVGRMCRPVRITGLILVAALAVVPRGAHADPVRPAATPKHVTKPVPPVPSSRRSEPEKAAKTGVPTRDGEIPFGVADTVFLALRNNRTIRSAQIDRIAQKFDLHVVEDRFTPQFGVSGGAVRQRIAGITTTSVNVTPGVTTLLPTGATVGFSWADQTTDTLGILARRSAGLLSVSQPLLRGAGIEVTLAPVRSARLGERINQLRLKATVSETIGQVIFAYRELLRAQEEVAIAQASVGRAQNLLDINKALIAAGRMAAVDIVQTEADLENQRIRVLEASRSLDNSRIQLLNLLALDLATPIVARESTMPARVTTNLPDLMCIALAQRPDYLGQLNAIEQNKLGIVVAQNERLWDLSVFGTGSLGRSRISGPLATAAAISDFTVGLTFNAPLNDLRREQPAVQATTNLQNAEVQLDAIRQGVELQIRNSATDIDIRWRQLELARRARGLAARAVEIEKEKLKVGRSANYQVRALENDLRSAENQQLGAVIGYLNALTLLDVQLGTTLDTWHIALRD